MFLKFLNFLGSDHAFWLLTDRLKQLVETCILCFGFGFWCEAYVHSIMKALAAPISSFWPDNTAAEALALPTSQAAMELKPVEAVVVSDRSVKTSVIREIRIDMTADHARPRQSLNEVVASLTSINDKVQGIMDPWAKMNASMNASMNAWGNLEEKMNPLKHFSNSMNSISLKLESLPDWNRYFTVDSQKLSFDSSFSDSIGKLNDRWLASTPLMRSYSEPLLLTDGPWARMASHYLDTGFNSSPRK